MQIELFDEITSDTLKEVIHKTKDLKDGAEVDLLIGSYGGELLCAIGVIDHLKRFKTHAYIVGFACSAAAIIAISCDEISMSNNASLMIHSAWDDSNDPEDQGIKRCNELQLKIIRKRCPDYSEDKLLTDTWLSAEDALNLNLCDDVYTEDIDYAAMCKKYAAKLNKLSNRRTVMSEETVKEVIEELHEEPVTNNEEETQTEETQVEEKHDLIEVVEKLIERIDELEGRIKALEEPVKEETEAECVDEDNRVNALYNTLCQPKASVSVICASSKPVVQKVRSGFEKYTNI